MTSRGLRGEIVIVIHFVLLPVTCIITYFISTSLNHVDNVFPYISDTGTYSPESCVFGILLAFYSFTTFLCVYTRWRIIANYYICSKVTPRLNNISLVCGMISSLGVLIVANFQESNILIAHLTGAVMTFLFALIYALLQSIISYRLPSVKGYSICLCHCRLLVAILAAGTAIAFPCMALVAELLKPSHYPLGFWDPTVEGFEFHIASTTLEWIAAGLLSIFFLTYIAEFRFVRIGMPVVHTGSITLGLRENSVVNISGQHESENL
ncbi:unnamed protein product [Lymnaea stagnalis]|uniref:CWH43-like N-terminal domain-containing protein n=1 Tax=Lymnaea stagnalis TaxID=6523 RepID=A0AAV2HI83_LYMST